MKEDINCRLIWHMGTWKHWFKKSFHGNLTSNKSQDLSLPQGLVCQESPFSLWRHLLLILSWPLSPLARLASWLSLNTPGVLMPCDLFVHSSVCLEGSSSDIRVPGFLIPIKFLFKSHVPSEAYPAHSVKTDASDLALPILFPCLIFSRAITTF